MASLTITAGPTAQIGKQFLLKHRPLSGGRHPSQEIQLLNPEVSRRHFLIRPEDDHHVITEVHSANGVFVNGQKIKDPTLQEGDQIKAGQTVLFYSRNDGDAGTDSVQDQRLADRQLREGGTLLIPPDDAQR
jgi:pSer/pThr/pTyr-binding forkhead associated (FHA) protein